MFQVLCQEHQRKMIKLRFLFLLPFIINFNFSLSYHIKPIDSSSGLIYTHLGKAKVSNQKYTLLTFVNLTHINNKIDKTYLLYHKSLAICNKLPTNKFNFHCQNQLAYINTKLKAIKNDFTIISHQLVVRREKRGLINGIGDGLKFLFGVPDSEDAQFYTDSINSLINNQKQTATLMQQQVRIISSTITNFNNSLQTLNQNTKILNENIKKFDDFMSQTATVEEKLLIENDINQHVTTLIEMTDEIQNIVSKYIDGITLISKGIISYNLLSPQDLYLELRNINSKYTLPLELEFSNIYTYYNIMEIQSFIKNNLLVVAIQIPLVNLLTYDLYQVHPLFSPHKNDSRLFSYIEPSKPYLLVSHTRTVYSSLNNIEECNQYLPNEWLCKEVSISKRTDTPNCEIELFLKSTTQIPKSCKIKHLFADAEIWHRISAQEWLFVLTKPTSINIICSNNEPQEEIINRIGILQLDRNCRAYSDHAVLEAQSVLGNVNITTKIPITDITTDDCCIKLKENITIQAIPLQPITLTNLDLNELKFAKHKLNQFDEILQDQLNKPFLIKHSSWFTLLLSGVAAIALLALLYKLYKWFGINTLIRKCLCLTSESYETSRLKSSCLALPCINIYNQSHNSRRTEEREIPVQYNAELEQLCYPSSVESQQPNRISGRRSTKSLDIRSSPLKLMNN